jgi:hypothetical protein
LPAGEGYYFTADNRQRAAERYEEWKAWTAQTGSASLQRLLGMVDVRTDREVWILSTSYLSGIDPGILWSYARQARATGLGRTGGGPDIPGRPQVPALDGGALARDLLLVPRWSDDLYIHGLEGCVWQGLPSRLRSFDWEQPVSAPGTAVLATGLRATLRGSLWASAHPLPAVAGLMVTVRVLFAGMRGDGRWQDRRRPPRSHRASNAARLFAAVDGGTTAVATFLPQASRAAHAGAGGGVWRPPGCYGSADRAAWPTTVVSQPAMSATTAGSTCCAGSDSAADDGPLPGKKK